jgi:hypothetical protein
MQPTKRIVRIEVRDREEHGFEEALRNTALGRCQSQVCCGRFASRVPAVLDLGDRFTRNIRPQLAEIAETEAAEAAALKRESLERALEKAKKTRRRTDAEFGASTARRRRDAKGHLTG